MRDDSPVQSAVVCGKEFTETTFCEETKAMNFRILHVSDLHLRAGSVLTDDAKLSTVPAVARDNVERPFIDLLQCAELGQFDLVAVSGDIAHTLNPQGLQRFVSEVAPLLKKMLRNEDSRICVIPGNHDVAWNTPPESPDFFDRKFAAFKGLVQALRPHFAGALATSLIPTGPLIGAAGSGAVLFETGSALAGCGSDAVVLCINSAVRCGELHSSGGDSRTLDIAHVTQAQRLALARTLIEAKKARAEGWERMLRIAVLHHHPFPFMEHPTEHKEFEGLLDASQMLRFLHEHDFHIVLSGHKHVPGFQQMSFGGGDMLFSGGGTIEGWVPEGKNRSLSIIEVTDRGLAGDVRFEAKAAKLAIEESPNPVRQVATSWRDARIYQLAKCPPDGGLRRDACALAQQACDVTTQSMAPKLAPDEDISDAFFLLCQSTKPYLVRQRLLQLEDRKEFTIEAIYDLFGSQDFLVKFRTKHERVLRQKLVEPLTLEGVLDQGSSLLDVAHELIITAKQPAFEVGPHSRSIKAFVYFAGQYTFQEFERRVRACIDTRPQAAQPHRVMLTQMYRIKDKHGFQLLAEYSVGCGGFYEVAEIVMSIERQLNVLRGKETFLTMAVWEAAEAANQ